MLYRLKIYRFTEAELSELAVLANNPNLSFKDRVYVHFALGKAFEDKHEYAAAFDHYEAGNSMKKAQSRYNAEQMTNELAAQTKVFTTDFLESSRNFGHQADDRSLFWDCHAPGPPCLSKFCPVIQMWTGLLSFRMYCHSHKSFGVKKIQGVCPGYPFILERLTGNDFAEFGRFT